MIRNPETQESKGFAFIDAPNTEEMNSIIRRFDRAPLEDRLLRANPAQPPRPKGAPAPAPGGARQGAPGMGAGPAGGPMMQRRPKRTGGPSQGGKRGSSGPQGHFAEELAKVL